jgi:hypothetical protein
MTNHSTPLHMFLQPLTLQKPLKTHTNYPTGLILPVMAGSIPPLESE